MARLGGSGGAAHGDARSRCRTDRGNGTRGHARSAAGVLALRQQARVRARSRPRARGDRLARVLPERGDARRAVPPGLCVRKERQMIGVLNPRTPGQRAVVAACMLAWFAPPAFAQMSPAVQRGLYYVRTNCARCHSVDKVTESPLRIAPAFRELHK